MSKGLRYQEPIPVARTDAKKFLHSDNQNVVCETIISLALYDLDWRWVQAQCLQLIRNGNFDIKGVAATCLGHIARIHHQIDTDIVFPVLINLLDDPNVVGKAEDALDDIKTFTGQIPIKKM